MFGSLFFVRVIVCSVGANPERIDTVFFLKHVQRLVHLLERHKHILNHVLRLVQLLDLLSLCHLEERYFWRNRPAEQQSEQWVVSDGNNFLQLPEDTLNGSTKSCIELELSHLPLYLCMSVEVIAQRDVFHGGLRLLQFRLYVLVKPRLIPPADWVDLSFHFRRICEACRHYNHGISRIHQSLYKVVGIVQAFLLKYFGSLVSRRARDVFYPNVFLAWDDLNSNRCEETL